MLIGGDRVGSVSGKTYEVCNPATGELVDTVPLGTAKDVEQAIDAAEQAFSTWAETSAEDRGVALANACELIKEHAAEIAQLLTAELIQQATYAGGKGKLPAGAVNVVTGPGSEVGEELLRNPRVRRIAFTGSTEVGRHVMEVAGREIKRVTLELGGSDPMIVCADADVDMAAKMADTGRFFNCGQMCLGVKRLFVHDSVYDTFVDRLKGILE